MSRSGKAKENRKVNYHHQRWWLVAAGCPYKGTTARL
jgi:hypothetical protein